MNISEVIIAALITGAAVLVAAIIPRIWRKTSQASIDRSVAVKDSPSATVVTGNQNTVNIDNQGASDTIFKRSESEKYNEEGRKKVQQWAYEHGSGCGWNWNLLSQAFENYSTSIRWDETNQHPWINKAYVYHLAGNHSRALECLEKATAIASPGRHHRSVKNAIQNHQYLTGEIVQTPAVPSWFVEQHF